ncbi:S1 family peptidase [Streptomyces sp. NEAU-Y11]|uniref:S1 family peptidase n=1 Tax=Streptomyces cucumeris TaxID=2962890 RepID=UPI0020C85779|nr:serine protease [Streptomyces sp. NEAU-Y11]MCP9206774.1 serine protease [Streptomyces sp. NEAU-Y11]MCP9211690.1 serine protease [Streptomyces sp. NEAU-Y11]
MRITALRKRAVTALSATALVYAALFSAAGPAVAVQGGQPARAADHPWAVALKPAVVPFSFCGGTLIAPTKVLTAGHCVDAFLKVPGLLRAVSGRNTMVSPGGTSVSVARIWRHPDYATFTHQGETGYRNDVAVLTLKSPIDAPTLPIAAPDARDLYQPGRSARILGWGTTSSGGLDGGVLRTATVPVTADSSCASAASYGDAYDSRQYTCAGDFARGGVDTCDYDSGTPLVVDGVVAGITSWGVGCGKAGHPGLYTRVSTFSSEITAQLGTT